MMRWIAANCGNDITLPGHRWCLNDVTCPSRFLVVVGLVVVPVVVVVEVV